MSLGQKIIHYINPIGHFGDREYSVTFSFWTTVLVCIALQFYTSNILQDPYAGGLPIIVTSTALIMYFAFRFGRRASYASLVVILLYYIYIVSKRGESGEMLRVSINAIIMFGILYFLLATAIGWLKEVIDKLVSKEVSDKKRLQTILQQLPVGVIIADVRGTVVEANELAKKLISQNLNFGDKLTDPALVKAIKAKKPIKNFGFTKDNGGGNTKYLLINSSPIKDSNDRDDVGVLIIHDITAEREIEKRKDDFMRIASHELKTPITSLILYLDILKKSIKKKDQKRIKVAAEGLEKQSDNLDELIATLLDVSRIQSGKSIFTKENFRLDELIKDTIKVMSMEHKDYDFKIIKIQRIKVNADKQKIYQVLTNLIMNACKFSMNNKNIEIELIRKDNYAQVSIKDYGIGISQAHQKNIFEKLYQVSDNSGGSFPGFGMGLYIAREIIKWHKGKIWVNSSEGKGSTFYFTLPQG